MTFSLLFHCDGGGNELCCTCGRPKGWLNGLGSNWSFCFHGLGVFRGLTSENGRCRKGGGEKRLVGVAACPELGVVVGWPLFCCNKASIWKAGGRYVRLTVHGWKYFGHANAPGGL
jgi:hypothetical protein